MESDEASEQPGETQSCDLFQRIHKILQQNEYDTLDELEEHITKAEAAIKEFALKGKQKRKEEEEQRLEKLQAIKVQIEALVIDEGMTPEYPPPEQSFAK